jgi:hypothetical protein
VDGGPSPAMTQNVPRFNCIKAGSISPGFRTGRVFTGDAAAGTGQALEPNAPPVQVWSAPAFRILGTSIPAGSRGALCVLTLRRLSGSGSAPSDAAGDMGKGLTQVAANDAKHAKHLNGPLVECTGLNPGLNPTRETRQGRTLLGKRTGTVDQPDGKRQKRRWTDWGARRAGAGAMTGA